VTDPQDPDLPGGRGLAARLDRSTLPVLLAVAGVLRLVNLPTRGTWEADQGHDMLTLRALVQDGVLPLLGPPTSIGDVHHGAWYYYLLSPAAAITGGDSPLAVVALIALAGIAAVGVVWWLARQIGGPLAGAAAGLVAAVSAAAIDESTFIWNPNLIALSSGLALAGAWRAWSGGGRRWWLLAAVGTAVTMQCHILGIALLPIVAVPYLLDARRRALGRVHVGVLAIFVVAYLPLLVNELTTGGSELRAALDYLAAGGRGSDVAIPVRFVIVGLRVLSWPLTGLITEGFIAALVASAAVIGIAMWRARADGPDRLAARWLGLGLLWSTAFLTLSAPSLATVVPGLPNDHYHAFADPMVFTLVGLGAAALAARSPGTDRGSRRMVGPILAGVGVVAALGWNMTHEPPAVHPDGGVPAGELAAARVDSVLAAAGVERLDVIHVQSLPDFKSTEAMVYPLARLGRLYVGDVPKGVAPGSSLDPSTMIPFVEFDGLVLLCDDRFREAIGTACGGPAEATITPDDGGPTWGPLLDRFEAAPDRFVSVYGQARDPG
jgi:4-amino-4-deoxy-L-arabinose transferase-like glycosyltransferase